MSNYRRAVVDSPDLGAYKFPARQRNVIQNCRYLISKTRRKNQVHIAAEDWRIINDAVLKQSESARSLHNVTLEGAMLISATS